MWNMKAATVADLLQLQRDCERHVVLWNCSDTLFHYLYQLPTAWASSVNMTHIRIWIIWMIQHSRSDIQLKLKIWIGILPYYVKLHFLGRQAMSFMGTSNSRGTFSTFSLLLRELTEGNSRIHLLSSQWFEGSVAHKFLRHRECVFAWATTNGRFLHLGYIAT